MKENKNQPFSSQIEDEMDQFASNQMEEEEDDALIQYLNCNKSFL